VSDVRTDVELLHLAGQVERWIRFGRVADERVIDRRRRIVAFEPGSVFALVRWQAGDHGTALSRIDILRAVAPGEAFTTVPFVAPGGELLLHIQGWSKVESVLQAIDAVERLGEDPCDAAPDHWRHVNNRLAAGLAPRVYDEKRHRAWRRRREITR
jgi:hypothetical protein